MRRSVLFTPGTNPDRLRNAPHTGADVVVFDLEDGVAPEETPSARQTVQELIRDPAFDPDCEVCVRVNPVGDGARTDITAVFDRKTTCDAVVLPKVSATEDVDTATTVLEAQDGPDAVLALVETASAVLHAPEIAACDATDALIFGAEDLAAEVGITRSQAGTEVSYARQRVVQAASAAGIDAIDTLYTDFQDSDGLRMDAQRAAARGFDGKLAIHPDQIEVIHDALAPSEAQLEWARRVLDAAEAQDSSGAFQLDGEMIDAPLLRRAEQILARADSPPSLG